MSGTYEGGCTCKTLRYRLTAKPLFKSSEMWPKESLERRAALFPKKG